MLEFIRQPWAWYVSGPMIAFVMFLLLRAGKEFGISSTLRATCSMLGAGRKVAFFDFDWKSQVWNLVFAAGALIGGFIATNFLSDPNSLELSSRTVDDLQAIGVGFNGDLAPYELFSWNGLMSIQGLVSIIVGGFCVGFGTRWAGGCTSGHAISGLSNLQLPSLIAVVGFFAGGLIMTHLIFPILFKGFNTDAIDAIVVTFSN